jgi:hypothetical protein
MNSPTDECPASSDYALWVTLANDPKQSEDARQRYRELMAAYLRRTLRDAFQSAALDAQTPCPLIHVLGDAPKHT